VTPSIPSQPRPGCPDLERLAAFVDGRLAGGERSALVAHLADCDACREIVAETARLASEPAAPGEARGAVVPFPRAERRRAWLAGAAAAAVALAASGLWLLRPERDPTGVALAALAAEPATRSALGEEWSEPRWSVVRGEGPIVSDAARAFRLGARAAALEVALGAGDRLAARRLAVESALLLDDVPLADPVASAYRGIASALAAPAAATRPLAEDARRGAALAREAVDPDLWALGRWAETGRLLAASGASLALPRPPRPRERDAFPAEVDALVEPLRRRAGREPAGRELVAEFERLLAAGGDLR
jgi:hypothetical protein